MGETGRVERRVHYRGRARAGRRVELHYRPGDDPDAERISAVTGNIGVGGAFILTESAPAVGTELDVELRVPTADAPIRVTAVVRWVIQGERAPLAGAGMGVKFSGLDVESLLMLSEYFASLDGETGPVDAAT